MHPGIGELSRIFGGQLPVEQRRQLIHGDALLLGERSEKPVREKVNVGVGDRQQAPRRVDHVVSIICVIREPVRLLRRRKRGSA